MSLIASKRQRTILKRKITLMLQKVGEDTVDNIINSVTGYLEQIEICNRNIVDGGFAGEDGDEVSSELETELDSQLSYELEIKGVLKRFTRQRSENTTEVKPDVSNCDLKLPHLQCSTFSGEGTSHLEYASFISQYNNVVGLRFNLSDSTKFTYLKSYLKGYALKVVAHLHVSDENFATALKLLETEFLNKDAIVDDLFAKLLNLKPKFDNNFLGVKLYINEIRCVLSDLRQYGAHLTLYQDSIKFVSHICFSNLPAVLRQEFVRKLGCNYPNLEQIYDNYVEVIRTLNLRNNSNYNRQASNADSCPTKNMNTISDKKTDYQKVDSRKTCKLCSLIGHRMTNCKKYGNYKSRMERCNDLKMCNYCSSLKHSKDDCPRQFDYECFYCKTKQHIGALCPKYKSNTSNVNCSINTVSNSGSLMLSTATVLIGRGKNSVKVRCLIDTASQRSYISAAVAEKIGFSDLRYDQKIEISSYLNKHFRNLAEIAVFVDFGDGSRYQVPIYVDPNFSISYNIPSLPEAVSNIGSRYPLADENLFEKETNVELQGLIGVDIIQYMENLKVVKCMNGSALQLNEKIIPFGDVDHFLTDDQLNLKYSRDLDFNLESVVNSCLNSFEGIDQEKNSLDLEKFENLFNLESIGIKETEISNYDKVKIDSFKDGITYKNGKYHIQLPWYENLIPMVKSNFNIAKGVLNKVVANLNSNKLFEQYNQVFEDQLSEGILEELCAGNFNVEDHIWIPHRPIIKEDSQCTTKIRPVLNCSLKIGASPSLNECSYPGVDLLNNLIDLLFSIRINPILVVADIRKAFLQIRLLEDSDKNKLSIIWQGKNGKTRYFRYQTLVFGLAASPFCLNYVIKHHLKSFPNDMTNAILNNGFYCDNLFYTGNDENKLCFVHKTAMDRMSKGGFHLRSWFSNNLFLQKFFSENRTCTTHGSHEEKVLGYDYNPKLDVISTVQVKYKVLVYCSKRIVASQLASLFDPMGLISPVIVSGKLFLRNLWLSKYEWDQPISDIEFLEWTKISNSFSKLHNIKFNRCVAFDNVKNSLVIFCDASKTAYGFCYYILNCEFSSCNLLFSKVKVSPLKNKSLPTLELLSIYLSIKCLKTEIMRKFNVKQIYICSDSQVALSWVLTQKVKAKNIFAQNRIKDITLLRNEILDNLGINCHFKYIPTSQNPADLLTRGMSFEKFTENLLYWKSGPEFLTRKNSEIDWPTGQNGCFSEVTKNLVSSNVSRIVKNVILIDINRFSSITKILRIVTFVFIFIYKLKRKNSDHVELRKKAENYLIIFEQNIHFSDEITFLQNKPEKSSIPNLVKNLNLFLDQNGVLRSKGRIEKCSKISFNVVNPIILPKTSHLTNLYVNYFHSLCKHLGNSSTLNTLRNHGFWIPKARNLINKIASNCLICKKLNSFSFKYPKPTNYLTDRSNFVHPYEHTGVDYTGSFLVKFGEVTSKFYILVYMCLNIRSIYLDLVPSMSTSDFLLSFIKFTNLFCMPSSLYSDNASTFLYAAKVINSSYADDQLNEFLTKNSIRHVKIPVYSAWMGGAWERLMRTIKASIFKTIGRKKLEYFQFISLLSDVQNAINERPLTYRDSDVNNISILTPNSFLKLGRQTDFNFGSSDGLLEAPSRKKLVDTLNRRDQFFENFKSSWYEDYLLSLRESSRNLYEESWSEVIKVGDVVLIYSPVKARIHWHLGRVIQLVTGDDGKTRMVKVWRDKNTQEIHAINHLYPLELSLDVVSNVQPPREQPIRKQPSRKVASKYKK